MDAVTDAAGRAGREARDSAPTSTESLVQTGVLMGAGIVVPRRPGDSTLAAGAVRLTRRTGYSRSPAPGPTGRPSSIQTTRSTDQQARNVSVYGSMVATTVPMPDRRS